MASKRRQRRAKLAAERREKVKMPVEKPRYKWDAQRARYIDQQGNEVTPEQKANDTSRAAATNTSSIAKTGKALYLYNVAVQKAEGKPVECGEFMAPSDAEVMELICKHHSVDKETDFTILDVHKILPNGIVIIRESAIDSWPKVPIVTRKGIIMRGQWSTLAEARKDVLGSACASNAANPPVTTPPVIVPSWKVEGETYIPRVSYTLKTGT